MSSKAWYTVLKGSSCSDELEHSQRDDCTQSHEPVIPLYDLHIYSFFDSLAYENTVAIVSSDVNILYGWD